MVEIEMSQEPIIHQPEMDLVMTILSYALCVVSAFLFVYQSKAANFISDIFKYLGRNTQHDNEIRILAAKLQALRAELARISPTAEFAAYFKKEREVNRTTELYDQAVSRRSASQPSWTNVALGSRVMVHAVSLGLLHFGTQPVAVCVPYLWPIGSLLRFPRWSAENTCEGDGETDVSFFVFTYLLLTLFNRFLHEKTVTTTRHPHAD